METKNIPPRVVWLDVVRLVAMFTVVCCHCTDPFNFYPGTSPHIADIKFWGAAYGAALRPCVPLFVMITGALLLPVQGDTGAFYKKRISRVFFPFLIWSVLYNLFPWLTGLLGLAPEVILDFFPYAGEDVMRQSLAVSLGYIGQIPVNFSILAVHMWYIYLLIGLYLYMPFFSAWVERASDRTKRAFLLIWAASLFLPYIREYVVNGLFDRSGYAFGEDTWNEFGMFYRFEGKCAIIDSKTGDRYMLRRVEHFPTDTCFWVHNSGEWNYNRFVLVFPPLPAKVDSVNFFIPDGPSRKLFDGTGKRSKNIGVAELRPKPAVEEKRGRTIY